MMSLSDGEDEIDDNPSKFGNFGPEGYSITKPPSWSKTDFFQPPPPPQENKGKGKKGKDGEYQEEAPPGPPVKFGVGNNHPLSPYNINNSSGVMMVWDGREKGKVMFMLRQGTNTWNNHQLQKREGKNYIFGPE